VRVPSCHHRDSAMVIGREMSPAGLRATPIKGFILDITGVLYNSMEGTDGIPIQGSVEAVNRLYSESRVRFLSNESTGTVSHVVGKLGRLGYSGIRAEDIITPAPTAAEYCRMNGLRPHLLVHPGIRSVFDGISQEDPNCVLIGDAEHAFTFKAINTAFRHLMKMRDPLLLSLGCGKFYQRTDGPCIDVGAFAEALKFASGCRHVVVGKPRPDYFQTALDSLGMDKEEVVMIGDDIVSDVGGAMKFGMRAIQVRTGKWRSEWESHEVKPTLIANDLLSAVRACID
ncbi:hypothetical protein PFISCL1PPCAC_23636, partial [Pristionchus fissidentatus]